MRSARGLGCSPTTCGYCSSPASWIRSLAVPRPSTRRAAPINEWWMLAPGGSVGVNDHHRGANLVSAQGEPE